MEYQTPKAYKEDECEQCGTCLVLCPVMHLSEDEARREMANLREGRPSPVLTRCTSCLDCDFYCPHECNPGELIINRWAEMNAERGLPERARFFLPHSDPNFRTFVIDRMSAADRALIESWQDMTPADEVCYPGCNVIATPRLTRTRALSGLDIRGSLEQCCGEMYFRMGLFDQLRGVARRTTEYFRTLEAKKVTILCTAGYYIFTEVLPHFGAEYDFEMESYLQVLKRRLDSGELEFTSPQRMRVAVQESCYGKQFGEQYMEIPREILRRAGAEVVEMGCRGDCMLCCGIGAGFSAPSAYNPLRLLPYTIRVMREAKTSGADAIVTYCSGCLQMFSTGKALYRTGLPTYHILEIISAALGEPVDTSWHSTFGWQMLAGTMRHQGPALLSTRRFRPGDIT
ncbi:MAG: (Fe-S)-binding protein [Actinobacteria bacterium]|nr:(Fe-S)-binding protein [Actinomycetota bacterium]MBU1943857.1 (Fe-S)-binding protein [Actinomycetota bacterium]MBU2687678.1 (Fe-S)-binding protein [Actinomycetota bacterium]